MALGEIELNISRANFTTWFKNTSLISKKSNAVAVGVPNGFTKEWLQNKYNVFLLKVFKGIAPEINTIEYVVENVRLPSQTQKKIAYHDRQTSSQEHAGQLRLEAPRIDSATNLNPKYTFHSFVVGSSNELAHAASWSVAKNPGVIYNPLFIYGGVGLGKTHLLQAIGNEIVKKSSRKNIKYLPSEKFTMDLVASIRDRTVDEFKEKYRKIDVLIIDDVQFLAGKEKTQEEFFHTFNELYGRNKQIILSSDRAPKSIATLEERLRSRFEGGMIADIGHPEFETRVAILKTKARERNIDLTDEVCEFVATHVQTNIRELEGALNRLMASPKLAAGEILDISLAKTVLAPLVSKNKKMVSWKKIIQEVARFYDITEKDMASKKRKKEFVVPRQIAMYLLRAETKSSYPFIGTTLGGRDHTTAIHACEKIAKDLENNDALLEELSLIKEKVYSG